MSYMARDASNHNEATILQKISEETNKQTNPASKGVLEGVLRQWCENEKGIIDHADILFFLEHKAGLIARNAAQRGRYVTTDAGEFRVEANRTNKRKQETASEDAGNVQEGAKPDAHRADGAGGRRQRAVGGTNSAG